jgi:general secretion pathway protein D
MLVLSGTQRELKHLLDTVDMFDVDWLQGMSVGVFTLRSADVKTLQPELNQLFGATGPLAGAVRVVPLERLNGFLMITTQPRYLERAKDWLEKLDQLSGTSGGQRLFVYQVQNGKAENLASLLGELFGRGGSTAASAPALAPGLRPAQLQSGPSATPIPGSITPAAPVATGATSASIQGGIGVSKDVRVIADKDNNALLILATSADYEVIESALRKLDIMARQVMIDVTIAEVTLGGSLRYGVDWYLSNLNRDGIANPGLQNGVQVDGGRQSASLTSAGGLIRNSDGILTPSAALGGFQFIRNVAGGLRAVITAIDNGSNVKVKSNPSLMVADNKQAQISVGTSISVNTGTINSGTSGGTTTQSYVNTGTIINVTPRVNAGGLVSLDIDAEVSVPGDAGASGANPPIDQRRLKTTVTVSDGEPIIIAGLIREDNRRGTAGLPLLSRLPVIGGAFGTQSTSTTRSELLISVTPRVVASVEQNRQLVDELRRKFQELGNTVPIARSAAPSDARKPTVAAPPKGLTTDPRHEERK